MDDTPRIPTADTKRQLADSTRWPLLVRLPDVSSDSLAQQPTKQINPGAIEYRFDPPQIVDSAGQTAIQHSKPEIRKGSKALRPHEPHVFERGRPAGQRGIPRRESPILPRSNPFSIPSARLIDSLAPAVRFLTMVALFTAAGIWIQMLGRRTTTPAPSVEPPKTAAQPAVAPAKNAVDHTVPAPTATGPLETTPESGARVGRANGDDFAKREPSACSTPRAEHPAVTPPHFLVASGGHVPRVQTSDPQPAGVAGDPARKDAGDPVGKAESEESSTVARYPGFLIETPTR